MTDSIVVKFPKTAIGEEAMRALKTVFAIANRKNRQGVAHGVQVCREGGGTFQSSRLWYEIADYDIARMKKLPLTICFAILKSNDDFWEQHGDRWETTIRTDFYNQRIVYKNELECIVQVREKEEQASRLQNWSFRMEDDAQLRRWVQQDTPQEEMDFIRKDMNSITTDMNFYTKCWNRDGKGRLGVLSPKTYQKRLAADHSERAFCGRA